MASSNFNHYRSLKGMKAMGIVFIIMGLIILVAPDQRKALQASEMDIVNGRLISDDDLNIEEDEWLRE